jgi:oxygen-dependent protoporphyrinogen oxidase
MKRIAVIGAGIGGLAAAHTLKKYRDSGKELDITLFESNERCGGKIMSKRIDGFLCEYGPNAILDNRPAAMTLCEEAGLKDKILRSNDAARKRFILSNNTLHQLPEGPGSFLKSGLISFSGKLRLMTEILRKKGDPEKDETIEEFAKRRLGGEAYDKLLDPMISGIFAGDPTRMSLKTSFERIHELERDYGGLFKAMIKLQLEKRKSGVKSEGGPAGPGGTIVSFKDGLQELIDALADELKDIIQLNTKVTSIKKDGDAYRLTVLKKDGEAEDKVFDKIVVCTPSFVMPGMFRELSQTIASELEKIPYGPVSVVALGFNKDELNHPLDGFGFLIPVKEKREMLGCLWTSSIFAHRAPEGKSLLRIMVGGMRRPDLVKKSDDELTSIVLKELKITMGITASPIFSTIYKHEKAIIQFHTGHEKISNTVKDELIKKFPGIYLGCNTYSGIGIDGAVKNSIAAAKACM